MYQECRVCVLMVVITTNSKSIFLFNLVSFFLHLFPLFLFCPPIFLTFYSFYSVSGPKRVCYGVALIIYGYFMAADQIETKRLENWGQKIWMKGRKSETCEMKLE